MTTRKIMSPEDIQRSLTRISYEIVERHRSLKLLRLIGIHTRGVPLAERLANKIRNLRGIHVPVGSIDISPYRDDLSSLDSQFLKDCIHHPIDISSKVVLLVDDVLYTGRSTRAAMDAIIDFGRPKAIQLAVLIDRGHRELPIRADYVGKNIPSASSEQIQVKLKETDGIDEVTILSRDKEQTHK